MSSDLVFGYGSLADFAAGGRPGELAGYRRGWGAAMDNRRNLPGYKYYLDAATGERPAVYVAFVDLRPAPGSAVNGVVFDASPELLTELDRRERNYRRVEVTGAVAAPPAARVWAYIATDAGRARRDAGLADGTLVVGREYLERVERGFAELGALERFRATTDEPPCPLADLRLVPLP